MKVASIGAALALAACAHGQAQSGPAATPAANAPVKEARKSTLLTADGQPFEKEQLRGKVVLLDFWATWCAPCRATMPATQRLADKLGPRGLAVYVVNIEKSSTELSTFLREVQVTVPVLRDPDGVEAEALGGSNLPFAVLLDRKGAPRFHHEGVSDKLEESLAAEAESLLAEKAQ